MSNKCFVVIFGRLEKHKYPTMEHAEEAARVLEAKTGLPFFADEETDE